MHMIIYLQVAMISQALIFVTRSHGFFFMERPSFALMGAFCLAQLVACIIAAFANWGFTAIRGISGGWIVRTILAARKNGVLHFANVCCPCVLTF